MEGFADVYIPRSSIVYFIQGLELRVQYIFAFYRVVDYFAAQSQGSTEFIAEHVVIRKIDGVTGSVGFIGFGNQVFIVFAS